MSDNNSISILNTQGKSVGSMGLPKVFSTPYRPEVIHKVFVNVTSQTFQRQGRYPAAGEMVSAESRNTGLGIARIGRAKGEGFQRAGQAAGVAGVRHGRVAHPPESWKVTEKKINKKEKMLGLCSAIAATARKQLVEERGHIVNKISTFPVIVSNDLESISKTKDLYDTLKNIGVFDDILRVSDKTKARSGVSRMRKRTAKKGKSALIVVEKDSPILKLSKSIPGVDVISADRISIIDLVPGSKPIRLTIYSENAIKHLNQIQAPIHVIQEMIIN
jgi:large subunit ribosomal protein L4e